MSFRIPANRSLRAMSVLGSDEAAKPRPVLRVASVHVSLCVLVLAGAACDSSTTGSAAVVRDSAGIRIVENAAPLCAAQDAWALSGEPLLSIGDLDDPAQQLFQVNGATRLSDGRIVIANGGSRQLRFYDSDGNHLLDAGRAGSGPGEFQYLGTVVRGEGDTLRALGGLNRVLTFDAQGGFVREDAAGYMGLFEQPWMTEGGRLMPDGRFLLWVYENRRDRPQGRYRPILGFVRFDPTTGRQDTLGWFLSGISERVGDETKWVGYSPNSTAAWSSTHMYAGDSEQYEIRAFDRTDARLSHIVRMRSEPVPVTEEMKQRLRDTFLARVAADPAQSTRMPMYERTMAELPWAESLPAFGSIAGDAAGNLWVSGYSVDGTPDDWNVFGPDGRWITILRLPAAMRILEIGDDYLIGLWRDDLDVEHVRVYSIDGAGCPS